tara:strand:+ start:316 stop:969 length:654 start_codon:yes stop_codon:yes gene_type:complete
MKKKERVRIIESRLDELYPNPDIPLWHFNEFSLLIAVLLSAQSTDKKVNELTPNLFNSRKTAKDIYEMGQNNIYECIKQLGLAKTKARNIYNLSRILMKSFNNQVPSSFEELESLPGVGHKTASVVMAQAFGIEAFPVDTHIYRLAQRWGLSEGINVKRTENDLKKLFLKSKWNKLHLQFIYYGREFCTARGCNGTTCELCKMLFPKRTKPIKTNKP